MDVTVPDGRHPTYLSAAESESLAVAAALIRDEALTLMRIERHTSAAYALMETANRISRSQFGEKGENP